METEDGMVIQEKEVFFDAILQMGIYYDHGKDVNFSIFVLHS